MVILVTDKSSILVFHFMFSNFLKQSETSFTEPWLPTAILDCEILPGNDFTIHRRDSVDRIGGGVVLAVRNTIASIRRKDLER